MLVPVDKNTGRKRQTSERDRHFLKKEKEKADYHNRNPGSRWKN